jgi:glycosyltransferase involved in cell wall biosynthesis
MRVLMLSKACIVGIYQRKLEEIARLGVELLALVPPSWIDERGETRLERAYTDGYTLETLPIRFNGDFHVHHYVGLRRRIREFRPDIVHIDEEPYNLATWQALYYARQAGAKTLFFSWQNINRRYPPPFRWGESWVLRTVDHAIAGTDSAAQVWREKGYRGRVSVIPQFGIDPAMFTPPIERLNERPFTIGYMGRLVEEKGVHLLLDAAAQLEDHNWQIRVIGGGPQRATLEDWVKRLGLGARVQFCDWLPSIEMPKQYHTLDALVLPSLTRPNWKEQFGRVLIEAMASGVPVVGSDSGAIPDVIGSAGLIFAEGDAHALAMHLHQLQQSPDLREHLQLKGRERVLAYFTHRQVAEATVRVYGELMTPNSTRKETS